VTERAEVLTAHHQRVEDQITRLQDHLKQIRTKIDIYRDGEPWSPPNVEHDGDSATLPRSAIAGANSAHSAPASH
jgi:hypothetical protein